MGTINTKMTVGISLIHFIVYIYIYIRTLIWTGKRDDKG